MIAYASRVFNSAESKYSVTHLEDLGVVWALKHFRNMIFGQPITVYTSINKYYWPTMRIDIEKHVSRCLPCSQTKGTTTTAHILEYPLPAGPFDVVGLDLLQLPRSSQGSGYILVCVDHFSRFVVFAPLRDKSAATFAHALSHT